MTVQDCLDLMKRHPGMRNTNELAEEHRLIPIMQAAQYGDMELYEKLPDDEKAVFDYYVDWFNMLRKENGGTLAGLDIDIPYSPYD
ncbi:MAG: hypothetical protein II920_06265 [Clostridia bacterium]|nr:hypothetical protein [Clostridia bacterium]